MLSGLAARVELQAAPNQYQRIWNAILAPSWDAAREILQSEPNSSLEVHVLELFDSIRMMDQMGPELLFSIVDASLLDLGNVIPIDVVASLRRSIRSNILPWGIFPRVYESDLSMDEADVSQLVDMYHWPLGPTRDHVQQLLTNVCQAMRDFRAAVESQQASEQERQLALETLHNRVQQVVAEQWLHLLPNMAEDLLSRILEFAD